MVAYCAIVLFYLLVTGEMDMHADTPSPKAKQTIAMATTMRTLRKLASAALVIRTICCKLLSIASVTERDKQVANACYQRPVTKEADNDVMPAITHSARRRVKPVA